MNRFAIAALAFASILTVPAAAADHHGGGGHSAAAHVGGGHFGGSRGGAVHFARGAHYTIHAHYRGRTAHYRATHRLSRATHHTIHRAVRHAVHHAVRHEMHRAAHHSVAAHRDRFSHVRRAVRATRRFHAGVYRRPAGWYAHRWLIGERLPRAWFARDYWINDWAIYGLWAPIDGLIWVRVGPDAVLVDPSGLVIGVDYAVFW